MAQGAKSVFTLFVLGNNAITMDRNFWPEWPQISFRDRGPAPKNCAGVAADEVVPARVAVPEPAFAAGSRGVRAAASPARCTG